MKQIISKLKEKKKLVLIVAVAVLVFATFANAANQEDDAEQTDIRTTVQTISLAEQRDKMVAATASGEIESLEQVTLSSEATAPVTFVGAQIGDKVVAGQLLVQMNAGSKVGQRTQAQADYESALASKASLEAQIDAAYATHDTLKISAASSITAAENALAVAQNNLQQNAGGDNVLVDNAYESMYLQFLAVLDTATKQLSAADTILGIDNNAVNDVYEHGVGAVNGITVSQAETAYAAAKQERSAFADALTALGASGSNENIEALLTDAKQLLATYQTLFDALSAVMEASRPILGMTQTQLDTLTASVNTGRTDITTKINGLTTAEQGIVTAKKSFSTFELAHDKAIEDVDTAKAKAAADIAASEAGLKQLEATLASQDASIKRSLGVISGINAELAKSSVRSPISGTVSTMNAKKGEMMTAGSVVAEIVNTDGLQVTAFVPGNAINVITVGGDVLVEGKPLGSVIRVAPSINQNTKKVEVIVGIEQTEDQPFVVGQFVTLELLANADLAVDQPLLVPLQAVKVDPTKHEVFVVENEQLKLVEVETGQLVGDQIEILSGLENYERIVASARGLLEGEFVEETQ